MSEETNKSRRDEQFWFIASAVGLNGLLVTSTAVPLAFAIVGSTILSLLALHLVLERWLACSPFYPTFEPRSARERFRLTWLAVREYVRHFWYVLAELSGACFYITIIVLSFCGVLFAKLACPPAL